MPSPSRMRRGAAIGEAGFALVAVLLAMVLMGGLAVALLAVSSQERTAGVAMHESGKAFYAAEAGLSAVLSEWSSAAHSEALAVPGDSLDLGWRPLENECQYRAVIRRVDAGLGPRLYTIGVIGRAGGRVPAERSVTLLARDAAPYSRNAMLAGGPFAIAGRARAIGPCGRIHVNGSLVVDSTLTVADAVTATGAVQRNAPIVDTAGRAVQPIAGADSVPTPALDFAATCAEADYLVRDGWVVPAASPADSQYTGGAGAMGWEWEAETNTYRLRGSEARPGTACVSGNVATSGDLGSPDLPLAVSIVATGAVDVTANAFVRASHPAGIVLAAGGDLRLNGSAAASAPNFEGLLYAGSQCEVDGAFVVRGQLSCRGDADPAGSSALAAENRIDAGATITFDCSAFASGGRVQPLRTRAWAQRMN